MRAGLHGWAEQFIIRAVNWACAVWGNNQKLLWRLSQSLKIEGFYCIRGFGFLCCHRTESVGPGLVGCWWEGAWKEPLFSLQAVASMNFLQFPGNVLAVQLCIRHLGRKISLRYLL